MTASPRGTHTHPTAKRIPEHIPGDAGKRLRSGAVCIVLVTVAAILASATAFAQVKKEKKDETAAFPAEPVVIEAPEPKPEVGVLLDRVIDPEQYVVGPGDKFGVSIPGAAPFAFQGIVNPEGTLLISSIGAVPVAGKTLAQAKRDIIGFLGNYFSARDITVSLLEIRRFRVAVSGAVETSGLQTVSANTRASEAIAMAGLKNGASQRSIRLIRGGDTMRVDLTAFDRIGLTGANPYLIEGDVIIVPARDIRWSYIQVSGSVLGPQRFEYVPGETIGEILDLTYGLLPNADTTKLELWRFQHGDTVATRVGWPMGTSYSSWRKIVLAPEDQVIVRGNDDYHRSSAVTISGEVAFPGVYVFPGRHVSLLALIDSAGGFTPNADVEHMQIGRKTPPSWETDLRQRVEQIPQELRTRSEDDWLLADAISIPGRISTDFVKLFKERDREYDVLLSDGDWISVPKHADFVNVIGRVVRPGLVPHRAGEGFSYYLDRAGGFAWRADKGRSFVIKGGTGATLKQGSVKNIDPGDLIVVPTKRGIKYWDTFKDVLIVAANLSTIYLVIDQATK